MNGAQLRYCLRTASWILTGRLPITALDRPLIAKSAMNGAQLRYSQLMVSRMLTGRLPITALDRPLIAKSAMNGAQLRCCPLTVSRMLTGRLPITALDRPLIAKSAMNGAQLRYSLRTALSLSPDSFVPLSGQLCYSPRTSSWILTGVPAVGPGVPSFFVEANH
jgi:hypothetical protein